METIIEAWFDGGCLHNPGGYASYGALIDKNNKTLWQGFGLVIPSSDGTSNNLAEYAGYVAVLNELVKQNLANQPVTIYGDSELVIEQMKGERKIKSGVYVPLARKAQKLTKRFPKLKLTSIPRNENSRADALARKALLQTMCVPCVIANEWEHGAYSCSCHNQN